VAAAVKEFWEVFATSGNPMLAFSDDGVFHDANPAACRFLRRSRQDIVGRDLRDLTAPSRAAELDEALEELLVDRHVMIRRWAFENGDGDEIEVKAVALPDVPEPGRHLGVVLTSGDGPPPPTNGRLSPRETEVAQLLARGLSGEAIARELFLSPETVRTHIRNAMEHVGARTRAHLVAVALRDGLIEV